MRVALSIGLILGALIVCGAIYVFAPAPGPFSP